MFTFASDTVQICSASPNFFLSFLRLRNEFSIWCTEDCGQKTELGQLKRHVEQVCPNRCGQQHLRQCIHQQNETCPNILLFVIIMSTSQLTL